MKKKTDLPFVAFGLFSAWSNSCRLSFQVKHFGTLEHVKKVYRYQANHFIMAMIIDKSIFSLNDKKSHKAAYLSNSQ